MATPMTSSQVVVQLKKWGIRYVEIPGWATHNRNSKGAWGGMNGFIWHHTGASVAADKAKGYASSTLYNGLSDLPGPLCHFSIGLDGTVFLVGWGRANHAGGGDPAVLQHVINEDYTGQLKPTKGNSNGVDGNAHFYGVEIQYSGSKTMADAQYKTALKLSAAILDFHGWSEKSVIAHGEWSSDKWDPGYAPGKIMAMPGVRADVASTLAAGPGGTPQEDDVALSADDIKKVAAEVEKQLTTGPELLAYLVGTDNVLKAGSDENDPKNTYWALGSFVTGTYNKQVRTEAKVDALTAAVEQVSVGGVDLDALATKVADLLATRLAK